MYLIFRKNLKRILFFILLSFISIILVLVIKYLDSMWDPNYFVPADLRYFLRFSEEPQIIGNLSVETLQELVDRCNEAREVMNWQRYGVVRANTTVLAVLAARDLPRLQLLVTALAQVRGIEQTLLVFSHSYYDDKINQLVRNIRFSRVMQVFYPNSLQLHPRRFPGVDPEDCSSEETRAYNDLNISIDCYERDARTTEHKHHWWWTTHYIFERLLWGTKIVIFLQEDDYVAPDLLHMYRYLQQAKTTFIKNVDVISLGGRCDESDEYDAILVDAWRPPYDRGLVLDRDVWHRVMYWAQFFCMYDDSSWSYSLLHQFEQTAPCGYLRMVASAAPRVMATRRIGAPQRGAEVAWRQFSRARLFSTHVHAHYGIDWRGITDNVPAPAPRGNGGFQDIRDQLLCLEPTLSASSSADDEDTTTETSTGMTDNTTGASTTTTITATPTEYLDYDID